MNSVGCAFFDATNNYHEKCKLPQMTSSFNAEVTGIIKAIEYVVRGGRNDEIYLICTDSLSTLQLLKKCSFQRAKNGIIVQLLRLLRRCMDMGIQVHFIWVKAHAGLRANEQVDQWAKEGADNGPPLNTLIMADDLIPYVNRIHKEKWKERFVGSNNAPFYKRIQPNPLQVPWYHKKGVEKALGRTISRLRVNCGVCDSFLNFINQRETAQCGKCGAPSGTLEHIIMECPYFDGPRTVFFSAILRRTNINLQYCSILASRDVSVYKELFKFIQNCNIHI